MTKSFFFLVICISVFSLYGRGNDLQPLISVGTIPTDFTNYTIEKINAREHNHSEEFLQLSRRQQKHFLKAVHQGIDEILRSGKVLFGDTLTKYVNAVGQKILGDDPSLKHIRFYTLKTNVVNAFSTNQGIIFVSQGLLAQVKNEAQLAFVLAHELAHYTQKHVIVGFKQNMELMLSQKSMSEKIKRYSIYSKDKEYEADRIGVKLYHKAGYNLKDLFTIFDLLSFSYLPFESKVVNTDYFNSKLFYLPASFFKKDLPKIAPDDDSDDSQSTHPNIKSRKDQLSGEIPKYKNWDEHVTLTSLDAFEHARKAARLEVVRNNLYDFDYVEALYNLYLLEDELHDNIYFNQYKAQTWLGLLIFKSYSRFSDISVTLKQIQGEQHQMHHVIRALNRRQLATLALRNIYDLKQRFPEDALIQNVYDKALDQLVTEDRFRLKDFFPISYEELITKYGVNASGNENFSNGTTLSSTQLAIERAKYGMTSEGKIDDNDFFRFGLSDIIQDQSFIKLFEEKKRKIPNYAESELDTKTKSDSKNTSKNKSNQKNDKTKESIKQDDLSYGLNNLILLEPRGIATRNNNPDIIESEELELKIKDAFDNLKVDFMQVVKIGSKEFKNASAEIYNEKAVLMNTLNQLLEYKDLPIFPVDYYELETLRNKYKSDKVAFLVIENDYAAWKTKVAILSTITTIPALAFQAQKSAEKFTFSMILFDLKKYKIDGVLRYNIHGKPNASAIDAICQNMLSKLNAVKPTEKR